MGVGSIQTDVREFLAVVAVAVVGLALAGVVAFTPWYAPGAGDSAVIELRGPAGPAAQEVRR